LNTAAATLRNEKLGKIMHRKSIDVWVGLFVLLGFAALVFLALKAGNMSTLSFGETYSVTGKFDNIGGLKPQSPVKSAGVVVGRVGDIKFDDKTFQALVTLELESSYKFPKDSSLKILTSGLLGEQYIGIEAGGDTNNLVHGDRINRTQSAAVLEDLINRFIYSQAAEGKKEDSE
jgi:phospholipid/cholesterol/gamma-HCH transport system substrate-binding protein